MTFEIYFSDLTEDARDEIVRGVYEQLKENYQEEGEEYLAREWHEPKPTSWQEAYCRSMAVDWREWTDWEKGEDDVKPNFESILDTFAYQEAERLCTEQIRHIGIEVEV